MYLPIPGVSRMSVKVPVPERHVSNRSFVLASCRVVVMMWFKMGLLRMGYTSIFCRRSMVGMVFLAMVNKSSSLEVAFGDKHTISSILLLEHACKILLMLMKFEDTLMNFRLLVGMASKSLRVPLLFSWRPVEISCIRSREDEEMYRARLATLVLERRVRDRSRETMLVGRLVSETRGLHFLRARDWGGEGEVWMAWKSLSINVGERWWGYEWMSRVVRLVSEGKTEANWSMS